MKRILFIVHEASRTGAPLLLLYFIKWLRSEYNHFIIDVLVIRRGALEEEFARYSDHYYVSNQLFGNKVQKASLRLFNKIYGGSSDHIFRYLKGNLATRNYDLLYCNSVLTLEVGTFIKKRCKASLLCHVHELDTVIRRYVPNFMSLQEDTDKFIAVSSAVSKMLVNKGVEQERIHLIYEYIEKITIPAQSNSSTSNIFNVGSAGTVHWRKGYDIFIQVAKEVLKSTDKIKFTWVGAMNDEHRAIVEEDLRKLEISQHVFFLGEKQFPIADFQSFDVFFLSSREDPFPLVCIESGMLGKPIICFDKAGGIPELIENGGGKTVSYLDINEAAQTILYYFNNPSDLLADGQIIKEKVKELVVDEAAPKILSVIKSLI
ncbi:glycosyltransferase [Catalinimonas sp. 4WD22]|uniref:glycosyltransferase n=1 Tax=Catalinimonas locisalis TaxID=3133978 RepID=UPI003100DF4E